MPFTLRTRRERAHLNLSSPRLLAKAHGHGVPGYPEEVGQRHRFPLQQRDMNHDESQQTTGIWGEEGGKTSRVHSIVMVLRHAHITFGNVNQVLDINKVQVSLHVWTRPKKSIWDQIMYTHRQMSEVCPCVCTVCVSIWLHLPDKPQNHFSWLWPALRWTFLLQRSFEGFHKSAGSGLWFRRTLLKDDLADSSSSKWQSIFLLLFFLLLRYPDV